MKGLGYRGERGKLCFKRNVLTGSGGWREEGLSEKNMFFSEKETDMGLCISPADNHWSFGSSLLA